MLVDSYTNDSGPQSKIFTIIRALYSLKHEETRGPNSNSHLQCKDCIDLNKQSLLFVTKSISNKKNGFVGLY